jgi:cation diffusion facilitator CzcD-associated flavoprotein CzcO
MEHSDVIVIGAGIGGLCAAKTYTELTPETNLLILESRPTVGGVWAAQNLYEGIKTNNLVGTYEFSDFPLLGVSKYGVPEGSHIPGRVMYEYLKDYAVHFDIFRLIQFYMDVKEVEKLDGGWKITAIKTNNDDSTEGKVYQCNKLIMCNGLASTPRPISIPGHEYFDRPIFNHGGLQDQAPAVAKDPEVKNVTIVGASKIGYDATWLMASHGKKVDWIVRESGGGAVWMSPPWIPLGPWMVMLEHVVTTRFFTWFSPCIWGHFDGFNWIRRLLHGTPVGRWVTHNFWEQQRVRCNHIPPTFN